MECICPVSIAVWFESKGPLSFSFCISVIQLSVSAHIWSILKKHTGRPRQGGTCCPPFKQTEQRHNYITFRAKSTLPICFTVFYKVQQHCSWRQWAKQGPSGANVVIHIQCCICSSCVVSTWAWCVWVTTANRKHFYRGVTASKTSIWTDALHTGFELKLNICVWHGRMNTHQAR